jgi:hypothetical protein
LNIEELENTMKYYENTIISLNIRINNLSNNGQDVLLEIFTEELKKM